MPKRLTQWKSRPQRYESKAFREMHHAVYAGLRGVLEESLYRKANQPGLMRRFLARTDPTYVAPESYEDMLKRTNLPKWWELMHRDYVQNMMRRDYVQNIKYDRRKVYRVITLEEYKVIYESQNRTTAG